MSALGAKTQTETKEEEISREIFKMFFLSYNQVYETVYVLDEVHDQLKDRVSSSDVEKVFMKMLDDGMLEEKKIKIKEGGRIGVGITQKGIEAREQLLGKSRRS